MGVHVSRVRSLTLDDLEPEVASILQTIGNAASNAVYESRLPAGPPRVKPLPGAERSLRNLYISSKYVDKLFLPMVDPLECSAEKLILRAFRAVESGNLLELHLAVAQGLDPNAADTMNGLSCVHYAASLGQATVLEFLLLNNGDASLFDVHSKRSAVHWAAAGGSVDCMLLLLRRGLAGHLSLMDGYGMLPADIAANKGAGCELHTLILAAIEQFAK